jgi:predicted ATPase
MKIELKNFGIVKNFKFDTKNDFTIIFGKNNTGKSYAISVVYLIIKNLLLLEESIIFRLVFPDLNSDKYITKFNTLLENKKSISIKKEIEEIITNVLSEILITNISESFKSTFDSIDNLQNKLTKDELIIIIHSDLINFTLKIHEKELFISSLTINRKDIELRRSQRKMSTKEQHNKIIIYTSNNQDFLSETIENFILESTFSISYDVKEKINSIYYLPASRSGLYQALSAFGQIIAELSKSRKFTTKKVELPSISEPLSDYFLELSTIRLRKKEIQNRVTEIANQIEENILHGKIEFDKQTKKIMFKPNRTDLKLDLSYTSSMVSEISPIVSYLRYVVNYADEANRLPSFLRRKKFDNAKPLIIIEEPEAHLHPDIQIALLKEFVELSKEDVKFIVTTHSNYMFNKFNNLVLSKDINIEKASSLLFKESKKGSNVIELELDEFGIEDENFIYTSENLYNEKMKLIKQLNQENN